MEKFDLLHRYLMQKGLATKENTLRPGTAKFELLAMAHDKTYLDKFINNQLTAKELRRMGLPWSEGLVKRTLISPNGTFLTAQLALKKGIACHLAGGTHHAHYDFGSGFCILNDLAIAARAIVAQGKAKKILIFDCDVHQGDGTAAILKDDDAIFTCSVHCDKNFPARKAVSDLDVEVVRGTTDDDYLQIVEDTLTGLLEQLQPDLVIYDAGVDIYEHDPLGLINISKAGIRNRDNMVLSHCQQRNIPVATVIGGGYDDDREALAQRHALVVEEAFKVFS
ncbi:histone deacetylase [Catenovulum sp. SM1970]|uniref:histone deacetylase family protein n=1 Tax=Marinifaba aquimaris TaxID=2741323 RepID=UPI001574CC77|nr:histone deacetylase [Marinifaba aquimaris]